MTAAFAGGVDVFGLSDVGLKRTQNEDHFVIASLRKAIELRQTNLADRSVFDALRGTEAQLLAVADGVGGQAGRALASSTAVHEAHERVKVAHGAGRPPATTLMMVTLVWPRAYLSALGGEDMLPSVGLVDFAPGDVLLICSDGLTKHVSDERIKEVLMQSVTAEAMTRTLVADAIAAGGSDNVTVVVARMVG